MTLERCRRILCCCVKQEDGRWPRRLQALLEVTTTTGRLQRVLPGATSASRFGGACEEGARAAGAVACFVRFSKSTTTARSVASISPATGPTTCRPTLVIVIVGHVLVPVILWVRGRLCTVASVSAWHLPSDCGLGLDSSPAAGQGRRRGAAMVAQDARLRRASARRTPGLRRKVRQRNGAREVGASASNFICAYPLNLFRVAKASAWCRASRPHLTSSHRRSAE